jgi:hypothetical protein
VANVGTSHSKLQLVDNLRYAASMLGADKSFFACFIHDREGFDSYRFLLACDPGWFYEYEKNECHLSDPWLTYARQHCQPVPAGDIQVEEIRRLERDAIEQVLNAPEVRRAGAAHGPDDVVAFRQQQFSEIRSVLPRDSRDNGPFGHAEPWILA